MRFDLILLSSSSQSQINTTCITLFRSIIMFQFQPCLISLFFWSNLIYFYFKFWFNDFKLLVFLFMKKFLKKFIKQKSLRHLLSFTLTVYIILDFSFYETKIKCEIYKINVN